MASGETKDQFEKLGGKQFINTGHKNNKPIDMPCWIVPKKSLKIKAHLRLGYTVC